MDIDIKDNITLSDNRVYIVVGKTFFQNKKYYYLIDKHSINNVKFCVENSGHNSLSEIEDTDLIEKLIPLFSVNIV